MRVGGCCGCWRAIRCGLARAHRCGLVGGGGSRSGATMIGGLFAAGMQNRSQSQAQEPRRVTRLDDSNQMAQFGVAVYKEDDGDVGAKKQVQWEETDEQREWRLAMDKDGRHQRVSQLSKETEGDSRVVSQLDAEYRHDEVVRKQVEQIQLEQEGEPGMPKSGILVSAAAEKAREWQNKVMLDKLDDVVGKPRTGASGNERAKLVAPRTPVLAGLEPGPLGNQLEWVVAERNKSRGVTPASPSGQDGSNGDSDSDSNSDSDSAKQDEEETDEEKKFLKKAFRALDSDKDRKVGVRDLQQMLRRLDAPKYTKAEIQQMIFEVDDDCDGYMGWDDCSNVWIRCQEPLVHKSAYEPRQMFDLLDFLVLDVRFSKTEQVTGRINNTEMLKLFQRRYGAVVAALEVCPGLSQRQARRASALYPWCCNNAFLCVVGGADPIGDRGARNRRRAERHQL